MMTVKADPKHDQLDDAQHGVQPPGRALAPGQQQQQQSAAGVALAFGMLMQAACCQRYQLACMTAARPSHDNALGHIECVLTCWGSLTSRLMPSCGKSTVLSRGFLLVLTHNPYLSMLVWLQTCIPPASSWCSSGVCTLAQQ